MGIISNKKAEESISEVLMGNIVYLIFVVIVFSLMILFLRQQTNGAGTWEDYYAKEVAKVIDFSQPGDVITIDVQKATEIAQRNKVLSLTSGIFTIDNLNQRVCVKLSGGRISCYNYFNNVDIVHYEVKLAQPGNVLYFEVTNKVK